MNPFKCFVCSQDISPKKRKSLKCQNKPCNSQCHYSCDSEIKNPEVAKTIEFYFCINCREEGGQSIIYKKEHYTRTKSTSKSAPVTTTGALYAGQNESSQDTNEVYETPHDPEVATKEADGETHQLQPKINALSNKLDTQSKETQTSKTENPSEQTQTESENSHNSLTQLKEKDDEINHYKEALNKKVEECRRLERRISLKDEQLKLINQSLSTETDEKHKLKAKLYLQSHHVTSLENALDKIKEPYSTQTSGTQTDNNEIATINTMLQHDLRLKDEHIETLSNEVEELQNINHTLKNKLHICEYEAMRRMSSNRKESYQLELESKDRQLQKSIETTMQQKEYAEYLEQKITKITNILHHDSPQSETKRNEKRHHDCEPNFSPISSNGTTSPPLGSNNRNRLPSTRSSVSSISNRSSQRESTSHSPSLYRTRSETGESPLHQDETLQHHDRRTLQQHHGKTPHHHDERTPHHRDKGTPHHDRRTQQHDDKGTPPPDAEKEKELINKKKKNIIILGLPEMDSNRTARREFIQLSEFITGQRLEKWDIKKIGRIGDEREGTSRPLKIELKHLNDKIDIMRNLHRLKNYRKYDKLVFQHDLTPHQLKLYSELKNEAQCRETISSNFYHRVRGQPGNWKIVKVPKN